MSVPTLDERVWRTTEPGTAPPRRRLEIVAPLVDAGIRTNVAIAPILPGLSDGAEQLAKSFGRRRSAGAHHIWANVLYLRPGTREHFLEALARDWPEESAGYERALRRPVVSAGHEDLTADRATCVAWRASMRPPDARPLRPRPAPTQLTLV